MTWKVKLASDQLDLVKIRAVKLGGATINYVETLMGHIAAQEDALQASQAQCAQLTSALEWIRNWYSSSDPEHDTGLKRHVVRIKAEQALQSTQPNELMERLARYQKALETVDRELGRGNLEDGCDYATKPGRDVCHLSTIQYLKGVVDEALATAPAAEGKL